MSARLRSLFQVWINQGDIVLLSLRDFQDDKADVIVKYTADEARNCVQLILFISCICKFIQLPQ
jgi:initiation factor 1A